ncbi:GntR family transcriptional regulator [Peribacillus frigoritolerans]|jgi:DNA-binding GntR family transcriptional regulator|uniref:GntR family transcriptional regulator n=1 Tax=Peribacillus frigoritolerans TaxID=450367 RepID=UPI0022820540|nr:GntR family transcriptional regulator [Peribacillus frigoritolerans]MCY9005601.1 GntR family transcriptional regulator [Peribacillus frigoritolerans]MED4631897.1 GntR family transcriptional regulator [Peribacillus frigoritolerans]
MTNFFPSTENQRNSLPDEIAHYILNKIFTGKLELGTRLIESNIARELNVSNIPVREAFYILQSTGIVERLPRRGVRVKAFSKEEINDYTVALIELYQIAISYSVPHWNEEHRLNIKNLLIEAKEKLSQDKIDEYISKCDRISAYIFKVAGNKVFLKFYSEITYITTAYCQSIWNDPNKTKIWHSNIEAAVNALIQSDFEQATIQLELLAKQALLVQ